MERLDFSSKVKNNIKHRASFICSNPDCRILTISASKEDESLFILRGIVAHIYPASLNGPRYNDYITKQEIQSEDNGIYLCANCSHMIDKNNGLDYPAEMLKKWKKEHEAWITKNLNKKVFDHDSKIIEHLSKQTQLLKNIANSTNITEIDKSDYPVINYEIHHLLDYDMLEIENMDSKSISIIKIHMYDDANSELISGKLPKIVEFGEKFEFQIANKLLINGKIKMKYKVEIIISDDSDKFYSLKFESVRSDKTNDVYGPYREIEEKTSPNTLT